jgi:predicted ABC-type ATPase
LGIPYFNPDEAARRLLSAQAGISQEEANSAVWQQGKRLLERAIAGRRDFAFETTLGGRTFTSLLEEAASEGIEVRVWYVGLSSPELHIARVRRRVAAGGHDIPDSKIRKRYNSSRLNLIRLLPKLMELRLYDNSEEADPDSGATPEPKLILHAAGGKVLSTCDLTLAPEWAKPILVAALRI